jgi:hypothetical protein
MTAGSLYQQLALARTFRVKLGASAGGERARLRVPFPAQAGCSRRRLLPVLSLRLGRPVPVPGSPGLGPPPRLERRPASADGSAKPEEDGPGAGVSGPACKAGGHTRADATTAPRIFQCGSGGYTCY